MNPLWFIAFGAVWLLLIILAWALALARAAALGDQQAEVTHLRPLRAVDDEPAGTGRAVVVSIHSRRGDNGGRAA